MNNFSNQNWNNQQNKTNNQQQANFNQQSNQQKTGFNTQNQQQQTNNQTQQSQQPNNQNPGLMQTLLNATLPALMQHFTGGQQMPLGGNNNNSPESQLMLSQVLMLQQQIIANQQDLSKRIFDLEISASQQLTSISQQLQSAKSIRLTHQKETKAVDFSLQQNDSNKY